MHHVLCPGSDPAALIYRCNCTYMRHLDALNKASKKRLEYLQKKVENRNMNEHSPKAPNGDEWREGFGTVVITTKPEETQRRIQNVNVDTIRFTNGILSMENGAEEIVNFCYHGPFTYKVEY